MSDLLQRAWFRLFAGIVLLLFGIGGIIAGFTGQPSNPPRYIIGGLVLAAIGISNVLAAQRLRQTRSITPHR